MHRATITLATIWSLVVYCHAYASSSTCGCLEVPVSGRHRKERFCRPHLTPLSERNKPRSCVCRPGLVRNVWGDCITKQECTSCKCFPDKDFNVCARKCPLFCNEPIRASCSKKCVLGCDCPPGYVRDHRMKRNRCVKTKKCAPTCPPHSSFQSCVSTCAPKCGKQPPKFCVTRCQRGGCVCFDGFAEAERDGEIICVPHEECKRYIVIAVPLTPGGYGLNGVPRPLAGNASASGSAHGHTSGTTGLGGNAEGTASTVTNGYGGVGGGLATAVPGSSDSMESYEDEGVNPEGIPIHDTTSPGAGSSATVLAGVPGRGTLGVGGTTVVAVGNASVNSAVPATSEQAGRLIATQGSGTTIPSTNTIGRGGAVNVGVGTGGVSLPTLPGGTTGATRPGGFGTTAISSSGTTGFRGGSIIVVETNGASSANPAQPAFAGGTNAVGSGITYRPSGPAVSSGGTIGLSSPGHAQPAGPGGAYIGGSGVVPTPSSTTGGLSGVSSTSVGPTGVGTVTSAQPGSAGGTNTFGFGVTSGPSSTPSEPSGPAVTSGGTVVLISPGHAQPAGIIGGSGVVPTPSSTTAGLSGAASTSVGPPGVGTVISVQPGSAGGINTVGFGITSGPSSTPAEPSGHAVFSGGPIGLSSPVHAQPAGPGGAYIGGSGVATTPSSATGGLSGAASSSVGPNGVGSVIPAEASGAAGTYGVGSGMIPVPSTPIARIGTVTATGTGLNAGTTSTNSVIPATYEISRTGTEGSGIIVAPSSATVWRSGAAEAAVGRSGGTYIVGSAANSSPSNALAGINTSATTGVAATGVNSRVPTQPGSTVVNHTGGSGITTEPSSTAAEVSGAAVTGVSPASTTQPAGVVATSTYESVVPSVPSRPTAAINGITATGTETSGVSTSTVQPGGSLRTHTGGASIASVPSSATEETSGVARTHALTTGVSLLTPAQPGSNGGSHAGGYGITTTPPGAIAGNGAGAANGAGANLPTNSVNSMLPAQGGGAGRAELGGSHVAYVTPIITTGMGGAALTGTGPNSAGAPTLTHHGGTSTGETYSVGSGIASVPLSTTGESNGPLATGLGGTGASSRIISRPGDAEGTGTGGYGITSTSSSTPTGASGTTTTSVTSSSSVLHGGAEGATHAGGSDITSAPSRATSVNPEAAVTNVAGAAGGSLPTLGQPEVARGTYTEGPGTISTPPSARVGLGSSAATDVGPAGARILIPAQPVGAGSAHGIPSTPTHDTGGSGGTGVLPAGTTDVSSVGSGMTTRGTTLITVIPGANPASNAILSGTTVHNGAGVSGGVGGSINAPLSVGGIVPRTLPGHQPVAVSGNNEVPSHGTLSIGVAGGNLVTLNGSSISIRPISSSATGTENTTIISVGSRTV